MARARNKVKQVILIQGKPAQLFKTSERKAYTLKFKEKTIKLGYCSEELVETLLDMNKYASITAVSKQKYTSVEIPDFPGLVFGRSGNNTTITVGSDTEENLNIKVENLTKYLITQGVIPQDRCHWICDMDKAKEKQPKVQELKEPKELKEYVPKLDTKVEPDLSVLSKRQLDIKALGDRLLNKEK